MEKDIAINRVLRDLRLQGLVNEEANGEVRIYLNAIWVAGWEKARHEFAERTEKHVIQYDSDSNKIGEDQSIEQAAKRMKCSRETIARAIKTGRQTVKGHIWKFAENGK